ncbi:MAG: PilZ domain-containing protein [Magnetococcales bacterium]|nr:PilZ domain-containing protein [Magnetococcales bacterium]
MIKQRIPVKVVAEVHFPYPDNLVFRGVTGNVSVSGAKINRPEYSPDTPSSAVDTPVVKLFLMDLNNSDVVTLPCDLVRSHRTGFGVRFLLDKIDPFLALGQYGEQMHSVHGG